jgi:hypothetical protein
MTVMAELLRCRVIDCDREAVTAWVMSAGAVQVPVCRPHLDELAVNAPHHLTEDGSGLVVRKRS